MTPNDSVEQRVAFLSNLKELLGTDGAGELGQAIDTKINVLNSFSHSKSAFNHLINCYKSALDIASVGNAGAQGSVNQLKEQLDAIRESYAGGNRQKFVKLAEKAKAIYLGTEKTVCVGVNLAECVVKALNMNRDS
jgi:hypothetical protein